jgi:osmoprotectant transport system permease protein
VTNVSDAHTLSDEKELAEQVHAGAIASTPPPRGRLTWQRLVTVPAIVAVALIATYWWISTSDLDAIEQTALGGGNVPRRWWEHIQLTAISTVIVLAIAIPLGVLLTRKRMRPAVPFALGLANIGQATPAIGLLVLLALWLGVGVKTAIIGIVVYSALPILSNTISGLRGIDPQLTEAARGIGMSPLGVLSRVELPLAVPMILAGVRNALVLNVGTATLATFLNAGGLGDLIQSGIITQRMRVLIVGSVLTVALALLVDWLASIVEQLVHPRGLGVG